MKKYSCFALIALAIFLLAGCGKGDVVKDNMSEITTIYFSGKTDTDSASISIGEREEPYTKDGKHEKTCAFSLICLKLGREYSNMKLPATISVNGEEKRINLELVSGTYMCDLEYKLKAEDEITLTYNETSMTFVNVSKDFAISSDKAIEIGREALKDKIEAYSKGSIECYLKILGEADNNDNLFWCFTVLGEDGKSYNSIISVKDGNIITQ